MKLGIILAGFIIVLIFLAILAIVLERYWRIYQQKRTAGKEQEEQEAASTPDGAPPSAAPSTGHIARWRARLDALWQPTQTDALLCKRFREWVTQELDDDPALQQWLLSLPETGFALLTEHIALFCQEMNFKLQWLLAEQDLVAPELNAVIRSVVIDYCHACQKAIPAQGQAKLFIEYEHLIQNPGGRQEQALQRALYANLASAGLVPTAEVTERSNGDTKERQRQARQAIQQAATNDWSHFAQVLQATINQ